MKHVKVRPIPAAVSAFALAFAAATSVVQSTARGTPVDELLDMSVLPSDPLNGWTYSNSAHLGTEASAYSVSGGSLLQTTIGLNNGPSGFDCYKKSINITSPNLDWVLEARVKVTNWEITEGGGGNERFAACFMAQNVGNMGVFPTYSDANTGLSGTEGIVDVGNSQFYGQASVSNFHTYRVEGNATSGERKLFIDGSLISGASDFNGLLGSSVNLVLGDGTGRGNADAEWTNFHFFQVPEPATASLLMVAAPMLMCRRRRV